MDRIIVSYYTSSLLLTAVGILLSIQTPPFYADIIILCAAVLFARTGAQKTRKGIYPKPDTFTLRIS